MPAPFALAFVLAAAPVGAEPSPPSADDLGWLVGTWEAQVGKDGLREEVWATPRGGTLIGSGREVRGGSLSEFEFLLIREADGGLVYDAFVGGGAPVPFRAAEVGDGVAVFENPAHDFPTRIAYRIEPDGRLHVSVSGADGAGFELRFAKTSGDRAMDRLPALRDLWNWGDPAASEESFRALLPRAVAAGDPGFVVEIRTQVARALGLQDKFAEAHAELDAIEPEAVAGRARVAYLLERGRVLRSSGHPADARPLFVEAFEEGRATGVEGLAVDAAHMVALVEAGDDALAWNTKALELAEGSQDHAARRWRASLLNNIGWTHHDAGRFEDALAAFQRAVPLRVEQGKAGPRRRAEWAVARALRSLGRAEEALVIQRRLQGEWVAAGGGDGYVDEEIAECLETLGRHEEAKPWFASAHAALSADPWMVENEAARLDRLARLAAE